MNIETFNTNTKPGVPSVRPSSNHNEKSAGGLKVKTNVKAGLNPQPLPPGSFPTVLWPPNH